MRLAGDKQGCAFLSAEKLSHSNRVRNALASANRIRDRRVERETTREITDESESVQNHHKAIPILLESIVYAGLPATTRSRESSDCLVVPVRARA